MFQSPKSRKLIAFIHLSYYYNGPWPVTSLSCLDQHSGTFHGLCGISGSRRIKFLQGKGLNTVHYNNIRVYLIYLVYYRIHTYCGKNPYIFIYIIKYSVGPVFYLAFAFLSAGIQYSKSLLSRFICNGERKGGFSASWRRCNN